MIFFILKAVLVLNPIQGGPFGVAHGWEGAKRPPTPIPKICHTYPAMMELGTPIAYLKKIQKLYESRDTSPEPC